MAQWLTRGLKAPVCAKVPNLEMLVFWQNVSIVTQNVSFWPYVHTIQGEHLLLLAPLWTPMPRPLQSKWNCNPISLLKPLSKSNQIFCHWRYRSLIANFKQGVAAGFIKTKISKWLNWIIIIIILFITNMTNAHKLQSCHTSLNWIYDTSNIYLQKYERYWTVLNCQ